MVNLPNVLYRTLISLLFVTLVVPNAAKAAEKPIQPNIIFIMVDDLGPEWISCYGAQGIRTPNIDALAKGGIRFDIAYSMPKCTPTRTTLLTGQYPFRHGWIGHWDVPRWGAGCHFDWRHYISFARVMKSAGYATVAAGKWQINDFRVQPDFMQRHGFDQWCMWTGYESGNPPSGERYANPYINTNGHSKTHKGRFGPDVYTDFLIDFMRSKKDQPFLAYFPMALTHTPFVATPHHPNAERKMERHVAMVRYTDYLVGRIIAVLDELKIRDRTIIFFTTDNGTSRGVTGQLGSRSIQGGKDTNWETGMRAPFIVNCPGLVPAGRVTNELTDFTDMLPTFAELGGASLPEGVKIDGRSIAPILLGRSDKTSRQWILSMGRGTMIRTKGGVHATAPQSERVIRNQRFKLWWAGGVSTAFYDLSTDPDEERNILTSDDPKTVANRLQLEAVLNQLPPDARPKYDPTPAQPWDKKIGKPSGKEKRRKKKPVRKGK